MLSITQYLINDYKYTIKLSISITQYLTDLLGLSPSVFYNISVSQSPFNIDDMNVDETTIMTIQDGMYKQCFFVLITTLLYNGDLLKFSLSSLGSILVLIINLFGYN